VARLVVDGVPASILARRWGVAQVGLFRTLGSTLDAIHDLGAQAAPAGTVVLAEQQTAGRGRAGRTWQSPIGGVWLGMLLRPGVEGGGGGGGGAPGAVAVRTGLVLADVVDELLGADRPGTQLKWPNDVLLDGRKLAGILCEGRWHGDALQWLALGVGVNVCNEIPPDLRARAAALREFLPDVRRIDVLDRLIPGLLPLTTHQAPLTESECAAFHRRDWLHGRQIRAPLFGRARGIRSDGALLVDVGGVVTVVREGHVALA
jgi:BirA family transcriptional regulator, biotin operon repressor / biotin---[acetyl-CoA-carboxylase] ligase